MLRREKIFTTEISTGSYNYFVDHIISLPDTKPSSYVCFANVHMVMEAYHNIEFNRIVNDADVVAPDGKPLSLFLKIFKGRKQDKVSGPDMLLDLFAAASTTGKRIFLYGSTDEVLERIVDNIKRDFPLLQIAGTFSPPYRTLSPAEKDDIIDTINRTSPHLVFVALGCPKQEKWMAEHYNKINACMLGVGQAFQLYAGELKRSPKWMQNLSLEWAYRLCLEPNRLWKRYLFTNSGFIFLACKYGLKAMFRFSLNSRSAKN